MEADTMVQGRTIPIMEVRTTEEEAVADIPEITTVPIKTRIIKDLQKTTGKQEMKPVRKF